MDFDARVERSCLGFDCVLWVRLIFVHVNCCYFLLPPVCVITELNHHVCLLIRFTAFSLYAFALERHPWSLILELNEHV